jgi:hypothetical protein
MRTTINLDDELLAQIKTYAARQRRTLTSVFEEALRRVLADADKAKTATRIPLPRSKAGGGPQPGVDLDDSAGLLDLLDEPETDWRANATS